MLVDNGSHHSHHLHLQSQDVIVHRGTPSTVTPENGKCHGIIELIMTFQEPSKNKISDESMIHQG